MCTLVLIYIFTLPFSCCTNQGRWATPCHTHWRNYLNENRDRCRCIYPEPLIFTVSIFINFIYLNVILILLSLWDPLTNYMLCHNIWGGCSVTPTSSPSIVFLTSFPLLPPCTHSSSAHLLHSLHHYLSVLLPNLIKALSNQGKLAASLLPLPYLRQVLRQVFCLFLSPPQICTFLVRAA